MAVNENYLAFIIDQLSHQQALDTKRMFGGVGFFKDGLMFGLLGKGKFMLKVDDSNRQDYEDRGMKAFLSDTKKKGMPYYEVPVDILENKDELGQWASRSIEVAKAAAKKK